MKVEIIVIGNELLLGKIKDLNAYWLANKLLQHGQQLSHISVVADTKEELNSAIKLAWRRSDLVITSGGLGPTKDDLTKYILGDYFKKEICFSQQAYDIALQHCERYQREYDKEKYHYHDIPKDFEPIFNPSGYAPGLKYTENAKTLICAPGVPREFETMISEVLPTVIGEQSQVIERFTVKTYKLPESNIFHSLIPDLWEHLKKYGEPSSLPHYAGVDIGVVLKGDQETVNKQKKELIEYFDASAIKENIYYYGNKTLPEILVEKAKEKKLTFGFAESCTGGLNSSRITDVSGSSSVFNGSIVSYSNEVKQKSLNVKSKTLNNHGAVSEETAFEMAIGARDVLNVDIAISTTGIAGPTGGSKEKPVGTVGIGISSKNGSDSKIYHFKGDRETLKFRFSQMAFFLLLDEIQKH